MSAAAGPPSGGGPPGSRLSGSRLSGSDSPSGGPPGGGPPGGGPPGGSPSASGPARVTAVATAIRRILAAATGRAEMLRIPAGAALFGDEVALDSLTGTVLLREIEDQFGVDVAGEDLNLDCLATLGTLATFVAERAPDGAYSGVTEKAGPGPRPRD